MLENKISNKMLENKSSNKMCDIKKFEQNMRQEKGDNFCKNIS